MRGASDAGIYVGQSKNIIVRRNRREQRGRHRDRELDRRRRLRERPPPTTPAASWSSTCPGCRSRTAATRASSTTRSSRTTTPTSPRRATSWRSCRRAPASWCWPTTRSRCSTTHHRQRQRQRRGHRQLPHHRPRVRTTRTTTRTPTRSTSTTTSSPAAASIRPATRGCGRAAADRRRRVCRTSSTTASSTRPKLVDGRSLPEFEICIANNGDADFVNLDLRRDGLWPPSPTPSKDCHAPLAGALPGSASRRDLPRVRARRSRVVRCCARRGVLRRRCVATGVRELARRPPRRRRVQPRARRSLADAPPAALSSYRFFDGRAAQGARRGRRAVRINTPLFSDYAAKHRFV